MVPNISKQEKQATPHTGLINFPVFRNYHDISIALLCMDLLATNILNLSELKFDVKFRQIEEIFKATCQKEPFDQSDLSSDCELCCGDQTHCMPKVLSE